MFIFIDKVIEESRDEQINPFLKLHRNLSFLDKFYILTNLQEEPAFKDLVDNYVEHKKKDTMYLEYLFTINFSHVFTIDEHGSF